MRVLMINFSCIKKYVPLFSIAVCLHVGTVNAKESTELYDCDQLVSLNLEQQVNQIIQSMTPEEAKLFVQQHAIALARSAACRYRLKQKNQENTSVSQSSNQLSVQPNMVAQGGDW